MSGGNDEDPVVHQLVAQLDYPMFIATVAAGGRRAGCLVGFATQCSMDPPRFLVCVSDKNRTFRVAREADVMVIHLVPDSAGELADLFGAETGDRVDKFERCAWRPGPGGTPVLEECRNWFAGRILKRIPTGDHCAMLIDPFEAASDQGEEPFTFHRARRIDPGHEA
ncbi:MAG: flavin reductase family protein [Actinomycetota bacterium]|nr:flavin reductase family protein [Actinomycetota bacterium]